ncbi:MAG: murein L,D-transpeptidase [Salinarimonadaceae bacterium]|nr:MAG: murein L,D-transpeptidase [Salinarimonadaceae bacterium]
MTSSRFSWTVLAALLWAQPVAAETRQPVASLEAAVKALGAEELAPVLPLFGAAEIAPVSLAARLETGVGLHPRLDARQQAALADFYAARGHRPLWVEGQAEQPVWNAAAKAVQERIAAAGEDGLEPSHYRYPPLGIVARERPADLASAELAMSVAAVLYARDARGARIDVARLDRNITPKLDIPDADAVLGVLAAAADPGAALADFNPPHEGYRLLRQRLAELRSEQPTRPLVHIPEGPLLRVGVRDPRVPLIRARFGVEPRESAEARLYDRRVAEAVADYQREQGLASDGIVGSQTLAALHAEDPARREADVIANMERWRWLPRDLGARSIVVNIPEYMMRVLDGDEVVNETRVIVGRPDAPTPIFSDAMNHVVVSPSWTIPPSILRKEVLPGLRADPLWAEKRGYQVFRDGRNISVRQPPGPENALGQIKFMFPNKHHVYLHDTPSRHLFNTLRRAHSWGCVRVEDPFAFADLILRESGWPEARLRALIGPRERTVRLDAPIPIHLVYFTMTADRSGGLRVFEDVYGFNQLVREALGIGA